MLDLLAARVQGVRRLGGVGRVGWGGMGREEMKKLGWRRLRIQSRWCTSAV